MPEFSQDSAAANCGFVLHVLVICFSCLYCVWLTSPSWVQSDQVSFLPDPAWSLYVPAALVCLFVMAPILYGVLNALSAARVDSTDSLYDNFTRQPPPTTLESIQESRYGNLLCGTVLILTLTFPSVPPICDLDVATINDLAFAKLKLAVS
jgi:hypothetical protein